MGKHKLEPIKECEGLFFLKPCVSDYFQKLLFALSLFYVWKSKLVIDITLTND